MKRKKKKILLASVGTRGDIEPFLAIGEILRKNGYEVTCAFSEKFRQQAIDCGFIFISLGSEYQDILYSKEGKILSGNKGSILQKIKAITVVYTKIKKGTVKLSHTLHKYIKENDIDLVIYQTMTLYPTLLEASQTNSKTLILAPLPGLIHPNKTYPSMGFPDIGGFKYNRLTYYVLNQFITNNVHRISKEFPNLLTTKKEIFNRLKTSPIIYTISPSLFPRPPYWPTNARIIGYRERDKSLEWKPPQILTDFLKTHKNILFITFGSVVSEDPRYVSKRILEIVSEHKIPTIINSFSGGIPKPEIFRSKHVLFLESANYEWLFPKMRAIICHGGTGTTHMAVRSGCPTMIVPHGLDQFFWDKTISRLFIGPKGVPIHKIHTEEFEDKIIDLFTNVAYRERAKLIAKKMENETSDLDLVNYINKLLI